MILTEDKAESTTTVRIGIFPELQIHWRYMSGVFPFN